MDDDRSSLHRQLRGIAGVLDVTGDRPRPGCVTIRAVAGHGPRIRAAAIALAPSIEVHVLEDDLVAVVPALPPADPGRRRRAADRRRREHADLDGAAVLLRCDFALCGHRPDTAAGLRVGDPCAVKIRGDDGWVACPGHYAVQRGRPRWASRVRRLLGRDGG